MDRNLLQILACPSCGGDVALEDGWVVCGACGRGYPIRDGIPVMVIEEARARADGAPGAERESN